MRLNKIGKDIDELIADLKLAKAEGLYVHIDALFGTVEGAVQGMNTRGDIRLLDGVNNEHFVNIHFVRQIQW